MKFPQWEHGGTREHRGTFKKPRDQQVQAPSSNVLPGALVFEDKPRPLDFERYTKYDI
jgi:hypothetical protein